MCWGSGESKSRLAKAAGAEPSAGQKLHAPGEAHVQVKTGSEHFWKLGCSESARGCSAKTVRSQNGKAPHARSTFGRWAVQKVHAVVAWSTCGSQNVKSTPRSDHFWTFNRLFFVGGAMDSLHRQKWAKTWGCCGSLKNDGRCGTLEEDLQRCILRGRHSTRDISIRYVGRSGRWFRERGCIMEYQILRFAMIIVAWQAQHFVRLGVTHLSLESLPPPWRHYY